MNLATLIDCLAPTGLEGLAFPRHLLGTFRRKSISFHNGLTDEATIVYWVQSKSFSIDLRLPQARKTPVTERQGWIGDTLWDEQSKLLSWNIERSYQPRNQWPEPAALHFIGNSVLEFAPSGAYVEDWRQQSSHGLFLGLRLVSMRDETTGQETAMDGGLVIAGEHAAYAQSRLRNVEEKLQGVSDLRLALAEGLMTEAEIDSYEVSVAVDGYTVSHSTQPERYGQAIELDGFGIEPDGSIVQERVVDGRSCSLRYRLDIFEPNFAFHHQTACDPGASEWMEREKNHLSLHAALSR